MKPEAAKTGRLFERQRQDGRPAASGKTGRAAAARWDEQSAGRAVAAANIWDGNKG